MSRTGWYQGYHEGFFLPTAYVVPDFEFEFVILTWLRVTPVLLLDAFNGCYK